MDTQVSQIVLRQPSRLLIVREQQKSQKECRPPQHAHGRCAAKHTMGCKLLQDAAISFDTLECAEAGGLARGEPVRLPGMMIRLAAGDTHRVSLAGRCSQ